MRLEKQRREVIHILSRIKPLGVQDIIAVVCYLEKMTPQMFFGDRRQKRMIALRSAVVVLARGWGHSFSHIGRCMNRDHATIMYHWKKHSENFEAQRIVRRAARLLRYQGGKK